MAAGDAPRRPECADMRGAVIGGSVVGFRSISADADAQAWADQVDTNGGTVSAGRLTLVSNLIIALKAAGVWTKLDRLWLFAGEDQSSALTDMVALDLATAVNSPTFTTDRGYQGENSGSPTKYISLGFNPSADGVNYTLNSCHIMSWMHTTPSGMSNDGWTVHAVDGSNFAAGIKIWQPSGSSGDYTLNNDGASGGSGTYTYPGSKIINRSGASTLQIYANTTQANTATTTSQTVPNGNAVALCSATFAFGLGEIVGAISFGGSLSSTNVSDYYDALRDLMDGIGAP